MKLEFTIFTMRSWGWWKWWVFGWWQLWDSVRMWGFARLWIDATPAECRISWNGVKWILACCISTLVYIYIYIFSSFFFSIYLLSIWFKFSVKFHVNDSKHDLEAPAVCLHKSGHVVSWGYGVLHAFQLFQQVLYVVHNLEAGTDLRSDYLFIYYFF